MKSKTTALLLLIMVASLWSVSGLFVKVIDCSPLALSSARGLFAALTISFLLPGGLHFQSLTKGHWITGACLMLLSITFISGMKLTAAANVIVLQYSAPIWVAIIAPLVLRERTGGRDWLFMIIIFGGVILFFLDGITAKGIWGNVLGLVSGFFFAIQALLLRRLKNKTPARAMILGNYLTFIVGIPFLLASWPSLTGWLALLAMGVLQMGLPYFLYTMAVPRVSSLELVVVTMLEPVLCPLWVYLFLDERPGRYAILGAVTVIAAVTIWSVLKALEEHRLTKGELPARRPQ
ncbi:MAG: DMT family transporter [Deltaproteobacteria bacterium]|jgi:drug/metabolite transporter (DMT)-like permease|nr:DMT family transporter [Deltaproteobacteria bacterium]